MKKGNKDITITIFVIVVISSIIYVILSLWVTHGESNLLLAIYYSSENISNESNSELFSATTIINSSQYTITRNESLLTMNQTFRVDYFRYMGGISRDFSFQFIIESNQSIFYKNTELKILFVFIIFNTDNETIRFVSGLKPGQHTGWHKDDANFQKHMKLAHQTALQKTQEILELLDLHTTKEITFQEDYI